MSLPNVLRHAVILRLLVAALFVSLIAVGSVAEAQRSGARARRAQVRRTQARQARRVRARRVRRRRARQWRIRARQARSTRRQRRSRAAHARPSEATDAPADLDFVQEAMEMENEAPPPMVTDSLQEMEATQLEERRSNLDPELFGQPDDESPETAPSGPAEIGEHSPLRVRALVRAFHRSLGYVDPERGGISDYSLTIGPAAGFGFEYYPGAHLTNSPLAHLGLQVAFHHSFAIESAGPNDITYPTDEMGWLVGARFRIPLGGGSEIGAELAGGQQSFRVHRGDLDNTSPTGVPFSDYSFLRAGGSFRVNLGEFTVGGRAAYLPTFDLGGLGTELGGGFGHGIEAAVTFLYPLDAGFSFIAELDTRVFVIDFDSPNTSRSAAGGAVDRYVGLNAGIEFDMPSARDL